MKKYIFFFAIILAFSQGANAQSAISGHVHFMNSKFETGKLVPAVNVQIRASGSNGDYSKSDGEYRLRFNQYSVGHVVTLGIGNDSDVITDGDGKKLEWVNKKDIETSTIPADPRAK